MEYTLEDPTDEEMTNMTKELQDVLAKYNCEMSVKSTIQLYKRIPVEVPEKTDVIQSPYGNEDTTKEESNEPAPEGGSEGSGEEPAE